MIPGVLFVIWALSIMFSWPVGNVAHFGGLIAGVIYGSYLKLKYKKKVIVLQRMFR
jgi:membrane associated rhomboid family serine protease